MFAKKIQERLAPRTKEIFVVYDSKLESFANQICDEWNGKESWVVMARLPFEADEAGKTLATVENICRWLLSNGADRDAVLAGIGGGVVTDLVGFAAGIYKRGIPYMTVPTTLLAQIDAAIGGKCASNLDGVKNVLGLFNEAVNVFIFTEPLEHLPVREWHSGAAEMLKTFLVSDPVAYKRAVDVFSTLEKENYSTFAKDMVNYELIELITLAGRIKASIVKKDPFDRGSRMVLNLGHTFGHAIEWWQGLPENNVSDPYAHGEAVAIGIIRAAEISEREGIAEKGLAKRLKKDFESCGLPTVFPCPVDELIPAFKSDKKVHEDTITYVYLRGVGRAVVKKRDLSILTK